MAQQWQRAQGWHIKNQFTHPNNCKAKSDIEQPAFAILFNRCLSKPFPTGKQCCPAAITSEACNNNFDGGKQLLDGPCIIFTYNPQWKMSGRGRTRRISKCCASMWPAWGTWKLEAGRFGGRPISVCTPFWSTVTTQQKRGLLLSSCIQTCYVQCTIAAHTKNCWWLRSGCIHFLTIALLHSTWNGTGTRISMWFEARIWSKQLPNWSYPLSHLRKQIWELWRQLGIAYVM